jgi:hypothetical protein
VSGGVTFNAHFRAPMQVLAAQEATPAPKGFTCGQYAAGEDGTFLAPQFDVPSGDHSLYFSGMMTAGYGGQGVYRSDAQPTLEGTISVAVGIGAGQQAAFSIFRSRIGGTSTMTVHADGSGVFDFENWGSDEVRGNTGSAANVTGAVAWTCG